MIVERISLYHVRMPLVAPFETSFGRIQTRDCVLVEALSEGTSGWGECAADWAPGYSEETVLTAWALLSEFLAPAVLQAGLETPAELAERVGWVRGNRMAKAGLEMALWDLYGQQQGRSLKVTVRRGAG